MSLAVKAEPTIEPREVTVTPRDGILLLGFWNNKPVMKLLHKGRGNLIVHFVLADK